MKTVVAPDLNIRSSLGVEAGVDVTVLNKSSGSERESLSKGAGHADEAVQAGADRDVADGVLVAAAKNGDEGAFEALVNRHRLKLLALARRYTQVREDAEDVVQQTIHKAFVYLRDFEGKSAFSTWLIRIAINEALMWLRRARALREVPIDDLNGDEGRRFDIADASADPEATYLQREEERTLSLAIERLPPNIRIVLELKELRELSARETARQMGLSLSAVKTRVFHGRKRLRKDIAAVQHTRTSPTARQ